MNYEIITGDVLECAADVLVSTANPWLNMSGGVNGAIFAKCGDGIQAELREHQCLAGKPDLPAGSVVRTSAGPLAFRHIIHAVAIDPFYDSSIEIVRDTLIAVFDLALKLKVSTIPTPTLATGYGRMTIEDFGAAFTPLIVEPRFNFDAVTIAVRYTVDASILKSIFESDAPGYTVLR